LNQAWRARRPYVPVGTYARRPPPPSANKSNGSIMGDEAEGDNAELLALQRIDETCTTLQQQGQYLEALECMERGLVLRQHFFGADSDEVWRACKTVGEMCNLLAMTYLQQEDFAMARFLCSFYLSEVSAPCSDRGATRCSSC
jgi:hypothetical protein